MTCANSVSTVFGRVSIKRLGLFSFCFFFVKGLVWLAAASLALLAV